MNTWRDFLDKLPTDIEEVIMNKCIRKIARKNKRGVLFDIRSLGNSGWKDRIDKNNSNKYLTYRYKYTDEIHIYNTATYLFVRAIHSGYCYKSIQYNWENKRRDMEIIPVGDSSDEDSSSDEEE